MLINTQKIYSFNATVNQWMPKEPPLHAKKKKKKKNS